MNPLLDVFENFGANKDDVIQEVLEVSNTKLKKFVSKVREKLDVSNRAKLTAALSMIVEKTIETPRLNVRRNKLNVNINDEN